MKITIQGTEYASALDASQALTIERTLNAPSLCAFWLSLPAGGSMAAPVSGQRLVVAGDDGRVYFTGYLASDPFPLYSGMAQEGPRYRYVVEAVSDEVLLSQLLMPSGITTAVQTAGSLLSSLVTASGSTAISATNLAAGATVSSYIAQGNWVASAASAARMARASYRVLNGALSLAVIESVVHSLDESEGTLNLAGLTLSPGERRSMANDVTVCGRREPATYVTELFQGDSSTTQFELSAKPFFLPSGSSTLIDEPFNESSIDDRVWSNATLNQAIRLGGGGLVMDGGTGYDGQTLLSWRSPVEMGGTLLMEAGGIKLSPGSTGVVCGFFVGLMTQSTCLCGFKVISAQGTGAVSVQPLVRGTVMGSSYEIDSSALYKLRIRVHCAEMARATALYHAMGDDGSISAGGDLITAGGLIQMEIQPFVNGVAGMPVTLYDGGVSDLPVTCKAVPCSSINLIGTMRSFKLSSLGSAWVTSTPSGGGPYTRRMGSTAQAAECSVDSSGKLVFNTGFVPALGELITVRYRMVNRAVGRAVNATNQQQRIANGLPGQCAWVGSVTEPQARSSLDCRNAAQTLVTAASSRSALWNGSYQGWNESFDVDVWPGDALLLQASSLDLNTQVVVRSVKISYQASVPDRVEYAIGFANDWASDLAIRSTESVPTDAWLPAPISPTVLDNLNALTVTVIDGSTVTIQTGVTAPDGGGFEIRRCDNAFMAGEDPDLVMRASVSTLTFSRTSYNEQFFVRVFDGADSPNYSEFSAAIFVNLPLGS